MRDEYDEFDMPYIIEDMAPYFDQPEDGYYIPIDITPFIEKIYIAPNSTVWFDKRVKSVVKKYGLSEQLIAHSLLGEDPIY